MLTVEISVPEYPPTPSNACISDRLYYGVDGTGGSTQFVFTQPFQRELERPDVAATEVLPDLQAFVDAWSRTPNKRNLPKGYRARLIPSCSRPGVYALWEVTLASGHYRAAFALDDKAPRAFWVHLWRKQRKRNQRDLPTACQRARALFT